MSADVDIRPATRVGRSLIFEGGGLVQLSRWQWFLYVIGWNDMYVHKEPRQRFGPTSVWY